MKPKEEKVALDIQVTNETMQDVKNEMVNKYNVFLWIALLFFFYHPRALNAKDASGYKEIKMGLVSTELQQKHDYFYLEGLNQKFKGNHDVAYDLFSYCTSLVKQPAAMYELAMLEAQMGDFDKALQGIEQVVAMDSTNYWYAQTLVGLYQQQGKQEEAIQLTENMIEWFPEKMDMLFALLDLYNQSESYDKMLLVLDRLEDKLGKSEQMSMEKFRIYLQFEDEEKALAEIEALVSEYPSDLRYKVLLGDVLLQIGKKEEAYSIYEKVITEEPSNVMALLSLATYYEQEGNSEKYDEQIDLLLGNEKVLPEIKISILRMIISKGDTSEADSLNIANAFDKALQANLEEEQIPLFYAQYLLSKKDNQKAKPLLRKVLHINPLNKAARMMLLGVAVQDNDFEEVINICEPGIIATPETIEFYFYLAIAYNQSNRLEETIDVIKKALQQVDESTPKEVTSDFYSIMGDVYHQLNQIEKSFAAYDSALIYFDENISVLNNYAYFLSVENRELDKAEEMSYKAIKAEPKNSTFLDTYAWILFQKKNYVEAKIYIDDAYKNGGDKNDVVVEHCGDIYFFNGDKEQAVEFWKEAEELGGDSKLLKKKIKKKKYFTK